MAGQAAAAVASIVLPFALMPAAGKLNLGDEGNVPRDIYGRPTGPIRAPSSGEEKEADLSFSSPGGFLLIALVSLLVVVGSSSMMMMMISMSTPG
jgi:hypothetical protein